MKKIVIAIIVVILIAAGVFAAIHLIHNSGDSGQQAAPTADALRFKEEHERYNGGYRDNGEPHLNITIPANNTVIYTSFDDLMELMNYGTGVFFFGRPACPSCRPIFPGFIQMAIDMDIPLHYYYYMSEDRDAHNERYVTLLERLHEYLPVNDRDQDPGDPDFDPEMKRISVPHIFVVENGEVIAHAMLNRHPYIAEDNMEGIYDIIRDVFNRYNEIRS